MIKDPERYKTVMCQTWAATGECPYKQKCQFAHGPHELRNRGVAPAQPMMGGPMQQLQQQSVNQQLNGFGLSAAGLPQPLPPPNAWANAAAHATKNNAAASMMSMGGLQMPPLPPGPPPPMQQPFGTPSTQPGQPLSQLPLPGALLGASSHNSAGGLAICGACAPSAEPPQMPPQMPGALVGGIDYASLAPAAEPPRPPPQLPQPPSSTSTFSAFPLMGQQNASTAPVPAAHATTTSHTTSSRVVGAVAPAPSASDEMAMFAMRCHEVDSSHPSAPTPTSLAPAVAPTALKPPPKLPNISIWAAPEPLRPNNHNRHTNNGVGGGAGVIGGARPEANPIHHSPHHPQLDSPLDPPLVGSKGSGEVSFSSLLVRRMASFVMADNDAFAGSPSLEKAMEKVLMPNSPGLNHMEQPRQLASPHGVNTQSPHTAIAA